ncbi:MAG: PP2C family protein-serine/threonine phosphatase [Solirubrobacterales bacterium]
MPEPKFTAAQVASVVGSALVVFVFWAATGGSTGAGVSFFYALPVGIGTWWWGRRAGAVLVAACIGLFLIGDTIHPTQYFWSALIVRSIAFTLVAVLAAAARERITVLEHSAEELDAIRAALTPSTLPELHGIDAAAAFVPSELGLSGDFYLLTNGPDGSTVAIVGDVVGHGPTAARLATFIRARFAAFAASTADPAELLMLANGALIDRPGGSDELVSAVCLRFRPDEPTVSWAIAGHPPPLRLPDLAELRRDSETFLLGAKPELALDNTDTVLHGDDGVLIYTDGATDVRQDGSFLGLDGLARLLSPLTSLPAAEMMSQAEQTILSWTDVPIRDDLCLVVLKPE